jgi:hypothetical protein
VLVRIRRAVHEIQFGGSSNVSSSINDRASSPNRTTPVLSVAGIKKEFKGVECKLQHLIL